MGKAKKSVLKKKRSSKPHYKSTKPISNPKGHRLASKKAPDIPQQPTIPFSPNDRILLVGEGDFSFSHSLLDHHNIPSLLATSFDAHAVVLAKYPQAASYIGALEAAREKGCHILYEVDATKIGTGRVGSGGKIIKRGGFDKIVFNFPHVGGLTKDVNRQIRHNQELLIGFFKAAVPLLACGGNIVVTTFEGKPYESWDLKGLAKDAGLKSQRSFRFQASVYPGYKHARTLGNIEGDGGWKGEERPSRTYVLEEKDKSATSKAKEQRKRDMAMTGTNMDPVSNKREANGKKRKREETDSEYD